MLNGENELSALQNTSLFNYLNQTSDIFYLVDKDLIIRYYNSGPWDKFAAENEAVHLEQEEQTIGRNILDLLYGDDTREIWLKIYSYIFTTKEPVRIPFKCHSSTVKRDGIINLIPFRFPDSENDHIIVQSTIYRSRSVPSMPIFDIRPLIDHSLPIVQMCSFCKEIKMDDEWLTGEDYYAKGGTSDVNVSHGVCPSCHTMILHELN